MSKIFLTLKQLQELLRLEKQIPFKGVAIRIRIILAKRFKYPQYAHEIQNILKERGFTTTC